MIKLWVIFDMLSMATPWEALLGMGE